MSQHGDSPIVARLRLGTRLRELRLAAGIQGEQAGAAIRATGSKISRLEGGYVPVRARDVEDLLDLYRAADAADRDDLLALAGQSTGQGWWDDYADELPAPVRRALEMEAAASLLAIYGSLSVPALLQTTAYADATWDLGRTATGTWSAGLQPSHLAHRRELIRSASAPQVWALLDEIALRRPVGPPALMQAQAAHLAETAQAPHITIQVLPAAEAQSYPAAIPFTITRFPAALPDRVWVELLGAVAGIERRPDVDSYWALVNHLGVIALDPEASIEFLRNLSEELAAET